MPVLSHSGAPGLLLCTLLLGRLLLDWGGSLLVTPATPVGDAVRLLSSCGVPEVFLRVPVTMFRSGSSSDGTLLHGSSGCSFLSASRPVTVDLLDLPSEASCAACGQHALFSLEAAFPVGLRLVAAEHRLSLGVPPDPVAAAALVSFLRHDLSGLRRLHGPATGHLVPSLSVRIPQRVVELEVFLSSPAAWDLMAERAALEVHAHARRSAPTAGVPAPDRVPALFSVTGALLSSPLSEMAACFSLAGDVSARVLLAPRSVLDLASLLEEARNVSVLDVAVLAGLDRAASVSVVETALVLWSRSVEGPLGSLAAALHAARLCLTEGAGANAAGEGAAGPFPPAPAPALSPASSVGSTSV